MAAAAAHYSKNAEGRGRVTEKKKDRKTDWEAETQRNRLYLGMPRCGGLV